MFDARALAALILGMSAALPAHGSSEEAWEALRASLSAACTSLVHQAQGDDVTPRLVLNEYGSDSYATALVVTAEPDAASELAVCIYDKASGRAQLTAPFAEWPDLTVAPAR